MKNVLKLIVFIMSFSLATPAETALEKGLNAYNAKNFAEAQTSLNAALEENPNNLAILNNLALTHYELNQKGKALAFWLKALKLDPGFDEAQKGVQFVRSKLAPNSFSVKETDFESVRKNFLKSISLNLLFALTALTFLVAGWQWIRHLSQIKKSSTEESVAPPISILSIAFSLLFLICSGILSLKIVDHMTPRAIVVKEKVDLKIAPGADQSKIIELNEGTEVDIGQTRDSWVQVKIPGNYSGWVNKEDIQIIL